MQRGFTVTELTLAVAIVAVAALASAPLARQAYVRHQVKIAVSEVQSLVQRARMAAVKEKVSYRLVLHDQNATLANHLELQKKQGNSFFTQQTYALPGAVRLLGSSMNSVTVSSQGICSSGKVAVRAGDDAYERVDVKSTCLTTESQ